MPIFAVDDPALITVYRGGFNFHGHIADTLRILEERNSDLYLFCQDDLILNPKLTPKNFWTTAQFNRHDGFIPKPESFSGPRRESWPWNDRILSRLMEPTSPLLGGGVEDFTKYLPPVNEARQRFARYGIDAATVPKPWPPSKNHRGLRGFVRRQLAAPKDLPYPLAAAFSDFFALRREALRPGTQYLGLFAAMDLFVEVSVPTAMILGCKSLCTLKDTPWEVHIDWTDRQELARRPPSDWQTLCSRFDDTLLYSHPVKLSNISMSSTTT